MTDSGPGRLALGTLLALQHLVLRLSYMFHAGPRQRAPDGYVVGMEEIAGLLKAVADSLPGAVTVNLARNPFYAHRYDVEFDIGGRARLLRRLRRLVVAPWVLGRLAARHKTFLYIG